MCVVAVTRPLTFHTIFPNFSGKRYKLSFSEKTSWFHLLLDGLDGCPPLGYTSESTEALKQHTDTRPHPRDSDLIC